MSDLDELANATRPDPPQAHRAQHVAPPQTVEYSTPTPSVAQAPRQLFRTGFWFGLGFFTAGLVFWIVVFLASLVLGGLMASACSSGTRSQTPPPPWQFK